MAATRTIGRMQEFYPEKETVTAYISDVRISELH
jgi:hypothetical protein